MRIIAGTYRGRVLKNPPDLKTRPTSDRLRETVFNVLSPRIDEATRFLDLCAGTGAIGAESLSRGAGFVTLVDRSRKSCALVEINLDALDIPEDQTEVVMSEAVEFLRRANKKLLENVADENARGWDIVYYDPPYSDDYRPVLELFGAEDAQLLREGGILIAEHHHKNELPDLVRGLRRWRILKQGDSCLSFYETK
ncbi:MAG: 16S rRNA (guanine(966)-N(2))-methyltransferase RsmD [Pyrinomonadaceae bacterium]